MNEAPHLKDDFSPTVLSMIGLPERDRIALWHDVFARNIFGVESLPLVNSDVPFDADVVLRATAGLRMGIGRVGGSDDHRTRRLLSDGNDDVVLCVSLGGPWILNHRGQEAVLQAGQGMLVTAGEPFGAKRPVEGQMLGICLSRGAVAPLVRNLDDAAGRFLPEDNPALRLLVGYARMLNADPLVGTSGVGHLVCDHFCDLLATALGATRDASVAAQSRGLRAAQFSMLRQDVVRNAGHRNLSVETLASRHRVTARSVQRLFEAEGTTFSQVVLEARLERAYCALTDVSAARRSIGEIAYDCGFGDISYFNRSFRRAFGITPSDLRSVD